MESAESEAYRLLTNFLQYFCKYEMMEAWSRILSLAPFTPQKSDVPLRSATTESEDGRELTLSWVRRSQKKGFSSSSSDEPRSRFFLIAQVGKSCFSLTTMENGDDRIRLIEKTYFDDIIFRWEQWDSATEKPKVVPTRTIRTDLSLLNCSDDFDNIKPGDVVAYWSTRYGLLDFHHYGVYVGDQKVIHFNGTSKQAAAVTETTWKEFSKQKKFCYVLRSSCITDSMREECVRRAKILLKTIQSDIQTWSTAVKYNPIRKNCEHFAKYCLFGTECSSSEVLHVSFNFADIFGARASRAILSIASICWDVGSFLLIRGGQGCFNFCASLFEPFMAICLA